MTTGPERTVHQEDRTPRRTSPALHALHGGGGCRTGELRLGREFIGTIEVPCERGRGAAVRNPGHGASLSALAEPIWPGHHAIARPGPRQATGRGARRRTGASAGSC